MRRNGFPWQLLLIAIVVLAWFGVAEAMGMGGIGGGTPDPTATGPVIVPGPLGSPMRLAIWDRKTLLVTDYRDQAVYLINNTRLGVPRRLLHVAGHPVAVARTGGLILVGNETLGRIDVFTQKGRRLRPITAAEPMQISDLAVDERSGRVYAVDIRAKEVKVFNLRGRRAATFGGFGALTDPRGVALDPLTGEILVSDYGDPRVGVAASIEIFDHQGQYLRSLHGNFSRPQGLAVGGGKVFLVDALLGRVLVYDQASGAWQDSLGSYGSEPGQLLLPMDVVLDGAGKTLYVTDNRNGRVTPLALAP